MKLQRARIVQGVYEADFFGQNEIWKIYGISTVIRVIVDIELKFALCKALLSCARQRHLEVKLLRLIVLGMEPY